MKALIYDILCSLKRWGVKYVFNINHHGDVEHCTTLFEAIQEARVDIGIRAFSIISEFDANRFGLTGQENHILLCKDEETNASDFNDEYIDIHAGAGETSMMIKYFPNQVNTQKAKELKPTNLKFDGLMKCYSLRDNIRLLFINKSVNKCSCFIFLQEYYKRSFSVLKYKI